MARDRVAGMMVVDKPPGMTSHDVVGRLRQTLGERIGHAGTLDPQATGVLLLCIGGATRMARFLQRHDKVYEGVVRFGWATDTYDAQGTPLADPQDVPPLQRAGVEQALRGFVGEIEQVPPVYSAKKIRGQPSYRRARRGEHIEPRPVNVRIDSLELLELGEEEIHLRVHSGPGTYVRTLAHDLGIALGCPAHLATLRRIRSGVFGLEGAVTWDEIEELSAAQLRARVLPVAEMVPEWPAAVLSADGAAAVANGGMVEAGWIVERRAGLPAPGARPAEGWVRLLDGDGRMIAAGEMVPGGLVQPRVVFGGGGS